MDFFFQDPNEIRLPPEEVRIRELQAHPWPDGARVRVYLEVDPFQKRPSTDLVISAANGDAVANASIIESMARKIELNMHLRGAGIAGPFSLTVVLFYLAPLPDPETADENAKLAPPLVVDRKQIQFDLPQVGDAPPP
jgi:hypothetical protein